jgi:hypothetical protein
MLQNTHDIAPAWMDQARNYWSFYQSCDIPEVVGGLITGLSSRCSCPATASMFLKKGESEISVLNFLPTKWKKDVAVQNGEIEEMKK